jgi:hypothetical protein
MVMMEAKTCAMNLFCKVKTVLLHDERFIQIICMGLQ